MRQIESVEASVTWSFPADMDLGSFLVAYAEYANAMCRLIDKQADLAQAFADELAYAPDAPTVADPPLANPARRNENRPRKAWESPRWRR